MMRAGDLFATSIDVIAVLCLGLKHSLCKFTTGDHAVPDQPACAHRHKQGIRD